MPEDIKPPFSLDSVRFDASGLVPVVTQDSANGRVLMLAYANREALQRTVDTGRAHYWSRSRAELWEKGATSGHTQAVRSVVLDCDGDAVLYRVAASGPACHTGDESCFHNPLAVFPTDQALPESLGAVLDRVYAVIVDRIEKQPEGSYVARLHNAGLDRVLKKVGEEAGEVIIAAKNGSREELTLEASDLLFHTLFTLAEVGVTPTDLGRELERRHAARPRPE
jgi:phosphoribosyl-ATP pyrophosphohydrolase/phosphoribosyl-AMP cyclohydrolase